MSETNRQPERPRARLISFRTFHKGTLIGFANVAFPSGMCVGEIQIHRRGDKCWAAPPARPWLYDHDNELVRDADGRVKWANDLINFLDHGSRRRWSEQVLAALREAKPEVLVGADDLSFEGAAP
jgi:hypothetical protein